MSQISSSGTQFKEEEEASTKRMLASSTSSGVSEEGMKIFLPNSLLSTNSSGECTILVQIDPKDCSTFDFAGATGAIGRLETDSTGVTLDFKGCQYQGRIYPGATALVLVEMKGKQKDDSSNDYLKVDAITDEFCRLTQTGDALEKLNAVTQGDLYSEDESDNGNIGISNVVAAATDDYSSKTMADSAAATSTKKQTKRKRGASTKSSSSSTMNRKTAVKKRSAADSSKKQKTAAAAGGGRPTAKMT